MMNRLQVFDFKKFSIIAILIFTPVAVMIIIELTNFRFGEYAGISGSDWFKFFGGTGIFSVSVYTLVDNIKKHREVSKIQSLNQDIDNWIKFVELAGIKDKTVASYLLSIYEERKGEERSVAESEILERIYNVNPEITESEDPEFLDTEISQINENEQILLKEKG